MQKRLKLWDADFYFSYFVIKQPTGALEWKNFILFYVLKHNTIKMRIIKNTCLEENAILRSQCFRDLYN
jgi:hypothetical protein